MLTHAIKSDIDEKDKQQWDKMSELNTAYDNVGCRDKDDHDDCMSLKIGGFGGRWRPAVVARLATIGASHVCTEAREI